MVKYRDPSPAVPREPAEKMVEIVDENDPMKPWTLVARVEEAIDIEDARTTVLQPLVLEGVLTPTASGDIRVMNRERLDDVIE